MNKLILALVILMSIPASAGKAKLNFTHDNKGVDGTTVVLTAFRVYWELSDQSVEDVIQLGPPAFLPWKVVSGVYYYAKTMENVLWTPGVTVCFEMTAIAQTLESDRSSRVCKKMPSDPSAPVIIDVDTP